MAAHSVDPATVARMRELRADGATYDEIAAATGKSPGAARNHCKDVKIGRKGHRPVPAAEVDADATSFRESDDGTATASATSPEPVKTIDDAVRVAGVDLNVWYVERWECTQWTVALKLKGGDGRPDRTEQQQQYRVRLQLRRLVRRSLQVAIDAVFAKLSAAAPSWPKPPVQKNPGEPCLAVFCLFDTHVGKLAWKPETGNNYDLAIAAAVFRNAVEDLLAESAHRRVGRVLLPIGNDFFHIDNAKNTTAAGTPQDVDGRYPKVFEAGFTAVVRAVESLAAVAPVDVVWVPGNHDPTASWHLAKTVEAWFRRCRRVSVDAGPNPRKYFAYGRTLLGLTHGDKEQHKQLPSLMATERPAEWARAACREWLVGHMHRSRQWVTQPVDTHEGTTVRALRSLAAGDAWHHQKGFISGPSGPAAEVYWYGRDRGYAGHAVVRARE